MARGAHTDYEQLPSGTAPDVIMNVNSEHRELYSNMGMRMQRTVA
jgi:hypothetical protein